MKINLPHSLSKHCSSTSLIMGTKSKNTKEYTQLFTYTFARGFWSLSITFSIAYLRLTLVFSPPSFSRYSVFHIHVRFQSENQLSHSNNSRGYLQLSKSTLLNADNLTNRISGHKELSQILPVMEKKGRQLGTLSRQGVPSQTARSVPYTLLGVSISAFPHLFLHSLPRSPKDQGQDSLGIYSNILEYLQIYGKNCS